VLELEEGPVHWAAARVRAAPGSSAARSAGCSCCCCSSGSCCCSCSCSCGWPAGALRCCWAGLVKGGGSGGSRGTTRVTLASLPGAPRTETALPLATREKGEGAAAAAAGCPGRRPSSSSRRRINRRIYLEPDMGREVGMGSSIWGWKSALSHEHEDSPQVTGRCSTPSSQFSPLCSNG
jgi:hypothetical protein